MNFCKQSKKLSDEPRSQKLSKEGANIKKVGSDEFDNSTNYPKDLNSNEKSHELPKCFRIKYILLIEWNCLGGFRLPNHS